jgi:hypothetical protein
MNASIGQNFPVSDHFRDRIVDAITIKNTGTWWSAVLLIIDPRTEKPFLKLYKWQKKDNVWKERQSIKINNKNDCTQFIDAISNLSEKL